MIGYAAKRVFTLREIRLYEHATTLVAIAPDELHGETIRCHELARAIGQILHLEHEDGRYGFVEHTWLWVEPRNRRFCPAWSLPHVLDVYVPGSMPQVQLHDMSSGLPTRYYLSNFFDVVIKQHIVEELVSILAPYEARERP